MRAIPAASGRGRTPLLGPIVGIGIIGVACGFLRVRDAAGQQGVERRTQADGVEVWERGGQAGMPWFFQQFQEITRLLLPARNKLPFDRSIGFLVGVDEYEQLRPQLPFVRNDIDDMRSYLLGPGGFDKVYVVPARIADQQLIENYMLNVFRRELGPRDRLLFYYAGHGADLAGRTGYMQFAAAVRGDFSAHVVPIERVEEWARVIKAGHILFIIDACASGLGVTPRATDDDNGLRLASTLSGAGSRILLTAGAAGQKTFEVRSGSNRGNGVFTRALLDALQGDGDLFVTVNSAYAGIEERVARFAADHGVKLTPKIWPMLEADYPGTFVFMNPRSRRKIPESYSSALGAQPRGGANSFDEWPVLARESFDSAGKWQTAPAKGEWGTITKSVAAGVYRWDFDLNKYREGYALAPQDALSDFQVSVRLRMRPLKGCCIAAGLIFRGSDVDGYEFRINQFNKYLVRFATGTENRNLVNWTEITASRAPDYNRLSVAATGDTIQVYINDRLLVVLTDRSRLFGQIGLIAAADSAVEGVVEFDDFELRARPEGRELPRHAIAFRFPPLGEIVRTPRSPPITSLVNDRGLFERAVERAVQAQAGQAVLLNALGTARTPEEGFAIGVQLGKRGITLLPPEDQVRRLELLDRVLSRLDPVVCRAWMQGGLPAVLNVNRNIPLMDSVELNTYAGMVASGMILAARNPDYVVPEPDTKRLLKLIDEIAVALPPTLRSRFTNALFTPPDEPSTDPCWVERVIYAYGLQQPEGRRDEVVTFITAIAGALPDLGGRSGQR
jgi:hypothetical protein